MKHIISILTILLINSFAFGQNIKVDSSMWFNDELSIETINYDDSTILVQFYDSLGIISEERRFKIVDSIECFQCQEIVSLGKMVKPKYIYHANLGFSDTSITAVIQIGDNKYYTNGKLNRIINYLPLAYQYNLVSCKDSFENNRLMPCSAGMIVDFIIERIKYFDEDKRVFKVENYKNGILESTWNYKTEN